MANVWFCSDLHFGHKNIQKFRLHVESEEDNRQKIINDWKECVTKRDDVYVLGDACFTRETIDEFASLNGRKHLIRGNHDQLDTQVYLKHFKSVYGLLKYKEFWLSHAPIHPNELRGKVNLHGHVHYHTIRDGNGCVNKQYFNCCVENIFALKKRALVSLDEIRKLVKD
jgi:calcineurin-like phosphoesterase family protein